MNLVIDLNSDLGEGAGHDNEILDLVSSANIACGFHAGDASSMFATIQAALERVAKSSALSGDVGHGSQLFACHAYSVITAPGFFSAVRSNSDA